MKLIIFLILYIIFVLKCLSQIPDKARLPQNYKNKTELINFYRSRYKTEGLYNKIIDNHGEGFESLYGLRNMRTVLYGIVYRGGANNYFHKTNQRANQNPLQDDALINLCEEGFSSAIYLYSKNFETADTVKFCQSLFSNNHKFIYSQNTLSTQTEIYKILKSVYTAINTDTIGPIYLHCWNGWHQSGLISAIILRQFCDFKTDEAFDYWIINTDRNKLKSHLNIENTIRNFSPYPELSVSKEIQEIICPCKIKIPYAQDGYFTVNLGEKIVMKNILFQPNYAQLLQESDVELLRLVNFLKKNPEISIEISAHICNLGSSAYNLQLTEARAKAVFDFLVNNNIDSNRLVYKGYGEIQPIDNTETDEAKAKNRRIEFSITSITKNIYFQINTDFIEENSKKFLNHLISSIHTNDNVQFEIIPAVDGTENQLAGTSQENINNFYFDLKNKRVKAIYNYLSERGIQKNNIIFGRTNNSSTVSTNQGKDLRVILYVL